MESKIGAPETIEDPSNLQCLKIIDDYTITTTLYIREYLKKRRINLSRFSKLDNSLVAILKALIQKHIPLKLISEYYQNLRLLLYLSR